jgi:hypothetical protein
VTLADTITVPLETVAPETVAPVELVRSRVTPVEVLIEAFVIEFVPRSTVTVDELDPLGGVAVLTAWSAVVTSVLVAGASVTDPPDVCAAASALERSLGVREAKLTVTDELLGANPGPAL